MAEPPPASGGAHPSKAVARSSPDLRTGNQRATEEQESSSCGATTSADSPGDNSGEGSMGSCRVISSDRWAQALSLAIPMGVYGEDDRSAEGKEAAEETPLSWMTFVEPTYTSSSPPRRARREQSSRTLQSPSHCQQSEPGPQSLARRAEAEAAAAKNPEGRKGTVSSRGPAGARSGQDRMVTAAVNDSRRGNNGGSASSKSRGDVELLAADINPPNPLGNKGNSPKALKYSTGQATGNPKSKRRSSDAESFGKTHPEEGDEAADVAGHTEMATSAQGEAKTRTRGRRCIKRPARYEEWLADTSQEGEEHHAALTAAQGRQSQHKRARGGAVSAVFPVPRGVRRREEIMEPAPPPPELFLPRDAVRGGAATARKRRLMPWLDLAAVEAAVACCAPRPPHSSDRAIATGVAAAAAAAAAVAASAVGGADGSSDKSHSGGAAFYDGIQEVLRRAKNAFNNHARVERQQRSQPSTSSTSSAREGQPPPSEEQPETKASCKDESSIVGADDATEQGASPASGGPSREQGEHEQLQRSPPASAVQWPTLTREFEEAAERAAKEAAAFVASAGQAGASATDAVHVGPDVVRRFLVRHGRKPPLPAMRAPPQRAHQQLQMIQEQLLEQHRQQRMRQEQRIQQQQRNRMNQQRLESVSQDWRQDQLQLRLQLAQEHHSRQQQSRQELESSGQQGDLERKLLDSAITRVANSRASCVTQAQQQQQATFNVPEPQQPSQRQHDRVIEQLHRLALLGNIEALFSQQESRPNGERPGSQESSDRQNRSSSSSAQQRAEDSGSKGARSPSGKDQRDK